MQGSVGHDGLALLELHLHLYEGRDVGAGGCYTGWLLFSRVCAREEQSAAVKGQYAILPPCALSTRLHLLHHNARARRRG